jgi:hypothetical protein
MVTDLGDMLPTLLASPIDRQTVEVGDAQLARESLHDRGGHRHRVVEKRPEIAHGGELEGETEAVMLAATASDFRQVVVVQVKEAVQLCRRR